MLGGAIVEAMSAGDAALAARATMLVHVSLAFLVADAANVIARGVLRGASDVRYAAVVGIATSWLTTPPLTWLLGVTWGLGAVGGWIGLALEIVVGASAVLAAGPARGLAPCGRGGPAVDGGRCRVACGPPHPEIVIALRGPTGTTMPA